MTNKLRRLYIRMKDLRLRTKLSMVIVGTMLIILAVNVFMYASINRLTGQMDEIYEGNVRLNELEDALDKLRSSITGYLNTKSTDSLDDYYRSQQSYSELINGLEDKVTDNRLKMMERSIYYMSEDYLALASDIIEAKRGRNIEKYKSSFEESEEMYRYIKIYITGLNSYRFRTNTQSYKALSSAVSYLEILSMTMLILMALFDIFLVVLVTRNITRPLHELALAADKVAGGNLDEVGLVKVHSKDEVGVVTIAFNQMVSSIPGYLSRLREGMEKEQLLKEKEILMEANLKEAQLKYLQAQINPHFLFNTLNAGTQLAMMEKADRTYEYIQNVAAFFRYNISENDEVTLAQEIEMVDTYIYILNVRFSGEIHFIKEIEDEELLRVRIPGMTLQPLVENCVNYGIHNIDREGLITLSVYGVDDYICISVADNGIGMSQELIHDIMDGSYREKKAIDDSHKGNGVGVNNVFERLRLYYNDRNEVEIISGGRDQGTEVVISVPKDI